MNEMDELLQRLYRNSDEDLLREFKAAEAEVEAEGGPGRTRKGLNGFGKKWLASFTRTGRGNPGLSAFLSAPFSRGRVKMQFTSGRDCDKFKDSGM